MPHDNNRQNRRNPVAQAAIMRKGGVHDKSNKAKRQKQKQQLKRNLRAESFGSFFALNHPGPFMVHF